MIGDGPIRISEDEWVVMRDSRTFPAALIKRFRSERGEYYRVVTFSLDPSKRELVGRFHTLEGANDCVRYKPGVPGPGMHPPVNNWA